MRRRNQNPITLAIGIALIILGIAPLLNVHIPWTGFALLIAAGAVFVGIRARSLSSIVLALWLAIQGLLLLITIDFPQIGTIQIVLALLAGILILTER